MKQVVLAPYRAGDARRAEIWRWVKQYYDDLGFAVYEGDSDGEIFSIAQARNRLADSCQWDVALMIDADTIADPYALDEAVCRASTHRQMVMAGDVHMRMNKRSSNMILNGSRYWFPRPDGYLPKDGVNEHIYGEPSSGCFAISHELWDATGGFVDSMQGWGYEDITFMTQTHVVGDGVAWVPDATLLHFWHERPEVTDDTSRNHLISNALHSLAGLDHELAKEFLRYLGHKW
jgi:predicted glycosyltransferase involved in capsule biosynthesis